MQDKWNKIMDLVAFSKLLQHAEVRFEVAILMAAPSS
jgi:hypothetical protein